jgi:hypothetical protein
MESTISIVFFLIWALFCKLARKPVTMMSGTAGSSAFPTGGFVCAATWCAALLANKAITSRLVALILASPVHIFPVRACRARVSVIDSSIDIDIRKIAQEGCRFVSFYLRGVCRTRMVNLETHFFLVGYECNRSGAESDSGRERDD